MSRFRKKYTIDKRKTECKRIREKNPNKIPIIIEKHENCKNNDLILEKYKYLIDSDNTIGQILFIIRKHMKLPKEKALIFFIEELSLDEKQVKYVLPLQSRLMDEVYNECAHDDGFLYIVYTEENAFGLS